MENTNSSSEGKKFRVRKLELSDKSKGFIELLRQLTVCDSVSDKEFEERFKEISTYGNDHVICVMEDETSGKIIASGSVFIEKKFIRNCGKVGHIEDVVVDAGARGCDWGRKSWGILKIMLVPWGVIRLFWIAVMTTRCSMRNVALSVRRFKWLSILFEPDVLLLLLPFVNVHCLF
ncbi:Glucosamine 6-phosphate N-acetyltransferase [Hibiscus syriacus]|uniref:Glucosamine 6-phosphate N-acetyltransferase n=1 Tax=Hibiscus syriacus TaxID=106335 RepID=A0A6A2YIN1_HIBSY|nr:Glucosamine 6-phosphate N-acetyltransferase [Hibiscus syriacus]